MNEEWRGLQDGEVVFGVSGPKDTVMGEVVRYARTYAPDGEVTLQLKQGRKWVSALSMISPKALEQGGLEVPG